MRLRIYPYKEIAINSAFLEIPAEYQRRLQMSKVKQMVAEFNGIIVNPPKVSYRDGRYIVIDGQHTIVCLKTLNGGKDLSIVCRVYTGLTKEEEALVFAEQTGASTPLSAGAKLRAKLVGQDAESHLSSQLPRRQGYSLAPTMSAQTTKSSASAPPSKSSSSTARIFTPRACGPSLMPGTATLTPCAPVSSRA